MSKEDDRRDAHAVDLGPKTHLCLLVTKTNRTYGPHMAAIPNNAW